MLDAFSLFNELGSVFGELFIGLAIIAFIISILQCFFGYKLFKFWVAVTGFLTFGIIGGFAAGIAAENAGVGMFIGLACAVLGAFIAFKLYKVGVFLLCGSMGFLLGYILIENPIFALIFALVIGVLSVYFVKPVIILSTSISGGFTAGSSLCMIMGIDSGVPSILIGLALAVGGVLVQFAFAKKSSGPITMPQGAPVHFAGGQNFNNNYQNLNNNYENPDNGYPAANMPINENQGYGAAPRAQGLNLQSSAHAFSSKLKEKMENDNAAMASKTTGVTFDEACDNLLEVAYSSKVLKPIMPFIEYILYFLSFLIIVSSLSILSGFTLPSITITVLFFTGGLCFIKKKYTALTISFSLVTLFKVIRALRFLPMLKYSKLGFFYSLLELVVIGYFTFEAIKYFLKSEDGALLNKKIQGLFAPKAYPNHVPNMKPQQPNDVKIMVRCPSCGGLNSEDSRFCGSCGAKVLVERNMSPEGNVCPENIIVADRTDENINM